MKSFVFIILMTALFACNPKQKEQKSSDADTLNYTSIKTTKLYRTLSSGDVENKAMNCTILYNQNELKVNFNDSIWVFPITKTQNKPEGITFILSDKKFNEAFITSGDLHITTFTAKNGTGNITFM
jgi:hypothetical protein